jgi:hypothetical protein
VPDGSGKCEEALEDAGADASWFAAAVAFEIELGFQCLVDRLDDLTERLQESLSGPFGFFAEGRSDQGDTARVKPRSTDGRAVK